MNRNFGRPLIIKINLNISPKKIPLNTNVSPPPPVSTKGVASMVLGTSLIMSEMLPFVDNVKSNGIMHSVYKFIKNEIK
jgi:hypothetical protein